MVANSRGFYKPLDEFSLVTFLYLLIYITVNTTALMIEIVIHHKPTPVVTAIITSCNTTDIIQSFFSLTPRKIHVTQNIMKINNRVKNMSRNGLRAAFTVTSLNVSKSTPLKKRRKKMPTEELILM